jgi:hypothetical protein
MEQAEESVNRRLGGLIPDGESHQMHDVSAAALTCSGTNILGAELVERLTADTLETLMRTATSGDMQGAVAGSLIRIFWLGYAFGEAGDDA